MRGRNEKNTGITGNGLKWNLMEPPAAGFAVLMKDLLYTGKTKFGKLGSGDLFKFIILRVLQNIAYRIGYGKQGIKIAVPPVCHPDLSIMESNLSPLPEGHRKHWVFEFLSVLNNPDKRIEVPAPKSVIFELSNTCNYNCHGCGIGGNGIKNDRFMKLENLKKWAESLCGFVDIIRINGLGEATLHPDFNECVRALDVYPGAREIITNLSADLEIYRMLLKRNYVMIVSWDACSAELMHKLRKGSDFWPMVKKLKAISKAARDFGSPDPVLLFTLRKENMHELEGTIRLAAECGMRALTVNIFKYNDNRDWTAEIRREIVEVMLACEKTSSKLGVKLSLPSHLGGDPLGLNASCKKARGKCALSATEVVVRYNGDITPCNMMNPYVYGNMEERGFSRSWNDTEAKTFRHFSGTQQAHPFCKDCYYVDVSNRMQADIVKTGGAL